MQKYLRRQPWGSLWITAPWDGVTRPSLPATAEITPSGLTVTGIPPQAPVPIQSTPRRRRLRMPFGELLRNAPWAEPTVEIAVSDPMRDTTLIAAGVC